MNSQELSHMSKFPNLKIIVVDNNGYGIIRNTQDDYYGGKHFGSSFKDLSPLPKYDPKKILDSFNLNGKTINSHQYDKEDIVSFFKSKDQYLILDVDDNSELLTDYYGIN